MAIRRKGITILAAVGFLVFLVGAGFSETTASDSHQSHHTQATQGKDPAVAGCMEQSQTMGSMMSGMMNGMAGSGMMIGKTAMGRSPSDCGMTASANVPASPQAPCGHPVRHGCTNAESGT